MNEKSFLGRNNPKIENSRNLFNFPSISTQTGQTLTDF